MAVVKKVPFITKDNKILKTSNNSDYYVDEIIGFDVILYRNTSEINRVDKTNFMTNVGSINCVIRDSTSLTNLTITIEYNHNIDFNYVYINKFGRYYFVTDVIVLNHNLYEVDLTVDVLMSYKDAILELNAFVDRNETVTNPLLIDKKRVIEQGLDVEVIEIENDIFFKDGEIFQPDADLMYVLNGYKIDSSDTEERGG